VFTADIKQGADIELNALDVTALKFTLQQYRIDEVYLLAAMLSATGEQKPMAAWNINTQSLLSVLELARLGYIQKVFWPSSIAVFNNEGELEPSTMYGISKLAGEKLCRYYFDRYGVDVRSLRYPGLISYDCLPGGGTTDYAVHIYHAALEGNYYNCFLQADTMLPMMYMPDAIRATLQLMDAPAASVKQRSAYTIGATSFTPAQIAACIKQYLPKFLIEYDADERQAIADNWPGEVDDTDARLDWGWEAKYGLDEMTKDMLYQLHTKKQVPV
jgi:nucleoside-diphosphate-sugar epimerase